MSIPDCNFNIFSLIVKIIRVNPNPSPNNFAELRYFLKLEYFDSIYIFLENFLLCLPTFSL